MNFTFLDIPTPSGSDIGDWDDYRLGILGEVMYDIMKSVSLTAGYVYEQFKLDDISSSVIHY
jgi:hypothetical protein